MNGSKATAWFGAIVVHIALVAVLVFSVRWKQVAPEGPAPIAVELVTRVAAPAVSQPPVPEPSAPTEAPAQPPPPALKTPAPPPPPSPADIAREKAQKEVEKKAQVAKLAADAAKEKAKDEAAKKEVARKLDDARAKELKLAQDKANKEQQAVQANAEKQAREWAERQTAERAAKAASDVAAARARAKAEGDYAGKIRAKVRGNITGAVEVVGNPEAVFEVVQLPTGEVLTVTLKKSSGNRAYDEAVERAINKSSPLPKPDQAEIFQRQLSLKFRPLE